MGKIKSAIITALLVAAIAVLAIFALFSWQVPGSNGVKRYNSFISSIHLGADLTGEASTVFYPEGVISASDFNFGIPEVPEGEEAEDLTAEELAELKEKQEEYINSYESRGNLYLDKDIIDEIGEDVFKETVKNDAKVLSDRLGEKGYSSYSVSVQDDFTIKVSVPTNFTYSAYKQYDTSARSTETGKISRALTYLSYNGDLTLRNTEIGYSQYNNILTPPKVEDIRTYISSVSKYSSAGNYAVKINLTNSGRELFKEKTTSLVDASSDTAIGFYIGENQLISLTVSDVIDQSSFLITVSDSAYAEDYSIVLNSAVHGKTLEYDYNSSDIEIVYGSAALGDCAAIFLGVAMLLVVVAALVYSVIRYKKLGLVNALMILVYALTIITALLLIEIQLTIAGAITAVLGLALVCGSNFAVFEAVRRETKKGKTMQSSVKSGYRTMLTGILDLHVILIVISLMLTLICVGELSACGLIFFIASVASYVLHWFTRFMWYVISSPVKNKFAFGGFTREELADD